MPSSICESIPFVLELVRKLRPRSILDVGVGYGKWGLLFREYLEAWEDRVYPEQWTLKLHGIEVCEKYLENFRWLRSVYDHLVPIDVRRVDFETWKPFDLGFAGDVIEHLPKEEGLRVLSGLVRRAKLGAIVSIPLGPKWLDNKIVGGNPNEKHLSTWDTGDLSGPFQIRARASFGTIGKTVGVFHLVPRRAED